MTELGRNIDYMSSDLYLIFVNTHIECRILNIFNLSGNAYLPHFLSPGTQQPGHFACMNQCGFGGEYSTDASMHRATWLSIGDRFKSPNSLTRRYGYEVYSPFPQYDL